MIDSDKLFFNRGGICGQDLERTLVVKDAIRLVQPGVGVGSRAESVHGVR